MDFVTFFILAILVIIGLVFFGGLAVAALPVLIFVGIPLFVLWLLIFHTVWGVIVLVVGGIIVALAKMSP